jgi:para-nitrobenzyl esterase
MKSAEFNKMNTIEMETLEGRVRGVLAQGLAIFRGVPFAESPTGSLRFKAPSPAKPRSEVLEAIAPAPVCPQVPSRLTGAMGECSSEQDENCLTVSIWAPTPLQRLRPILVWFHGGGYLSGGGSLSWYDGGTLARDNDIVVVGVNSRLGALGYLFHPGITDGNMGLLDQILALEWIVRNAASFGGDPKRVTLMGQSGGAHSITCMLTIPKARQLMQRAILLSNPFALRPFPPEESVVCANRFCANLAIDPDQPEALLRLQSVPIGQILDATIATLKGSTRSLGDPTPPFGPTATGTLPGGDAFLEAVRMGAGGVDAIIGSTADETLAFYTSDPRLAGMTFDTLPGIAEALFGPFWQARIDRARHARPGATALEVLSDTQTAHYFREGVEELASAISRGTGNVWVYRFDWASPGSPFGACHCIELPFVFGTFEAFAKAPMLGGVDEKKMALSVFVQGAIARFVKEGVPTGDTLPHWATFTRSLPVFLQINSVLGTGLARSHS